MSYSCSNDYQFYSDLKFLQNSPLLIKGIVCGKNFKAIQLVVCPVGMTKDFECSLAELSSITPLDSL